MFESLAFSSVGLLAVRKPGVIVGPIADFLGFIYNILFNFIYSFIQSGSLGIAIILFTIIVKLVLFPLTVKQQKSTYKMQKLQPELNKIRAKYAGKNDQESQQRMAYEMQEFQKKNGINMFGGCLPLLIQLPILYALFYIFQQAYVYVDVVADNYNAIANTLLSVPLDLRMDAIGGFATQIADSMKVQLDMNNAKDIVQVVNSLTSSNWDQILAVLGNSGKDLIPLLAQKNQMENFLFIHLIENPGIRFPELILPILSGGTTWLSTKVMMKNQPSQNPDDPTAATMKTMNMVMPIMMGVMTVTLPAGLGLYWTVSNLFQVGQQIVLQKYFKNKDEKGAAL